MMICDDLVDHAQTLKRLLISKVSQRAGPVSPGTTDHETHALDPDADRIINPIFSGSKIGI